MNEVHYRAIIFLNLDQKIAENVGRERIDFGIITYIRTHNAQRLVHIKGFGGSLTMASAI